MPATLEGEISTRNYAFTPPRRGHEERSATFRSKAAEIVNLGLRPGLEVSEKIFRQAEEIARLSTETLLRGMPEGASVESGPSLDLASTPESSHDSISPPTDGETMADITREELDAKLDRTESRVDAAVARLETQFSEFRGEFRAEARHNSRMHQFTLAAISIFAVLMIGGAGFVVDALNTRMDRIEGQIDSLPAELRGIADSITSAITATQSGQPPVIVIERPAGPEATDQ